jgi:hypothetical protein
LARAVFELDVGLEAAVGDAGTGGAGAAFLNSLDRGSDRLLVEGQAQIVVGAQQDGAFAVDHAFSRRDDGVEAHAEGISAGLPDRVVGVAVREMLVEQPHGFRPYSEGL